MQPPGFRPQFGVRLGRHYQGRTRIGNRMVFSWETAQRRWRSLTVEFIYWRVSIALWRMSV